MASHVKGGGACARRRVTAAVGALLLACLAACGLNAQEHYRGLRPALVAGQYEAALSRVQSAREDFYGYKNRLLFYMDKAVVQHLAGDYGASNATLEQAKQAAEELWTESIGEHAASWLGTDNALAYAGEDFERVMLHVLAAFNYVALGDYEGAQVEARQVTQRLEQYNRAYAQRGDTLSAYRDDAFARWLSGKLMQAEGSTDGLNAAWIHYQQALEVYSNDYEQRYGTRLPRLLLEDALRVGRALGPDFSAEVAELERRFPRVAEATREVPSATGEVVLLHQLGEAPYKVDRFWTAPVPNGVIRVAYPEMLPKPRRVRRVMATAAGVSVEGELMEDITAIAMQNLADHMGRIKAKAISRSVAKYLTSVGLQAGGRAVARKRGDGAAAAGAAMQAAGILFNVGSAIAEEADKRSWLTLPGAIVVSRLFLPVGAHPLTVRYLDVYGRVVLERVQAVQVRPGVTFVVDRVLP